MDWRIVGSCCCSPPRTDLPALSEIEEHDAVPLPFPVPFVTDELAAAVPYKELAQPLLADRRQECMGVTDGLVIAHQRVQRHGAIEPIFQPFFNKIGDGRHFGNACQGRDINAI